MTYEQAREELIKLKAEIKVLENKKDHLDTIYQLKQVKMQEYLEALRKEKVDVEQLEKNSFSAILAKMLGNYEEKYNKEYREYMEAKKNHDAFIAEIEDCRAEIDYIDTELAKMRIEVAQRKETIIAEYPEGREEAKEEELRKNQLYAQRKEIKEAISAVSKVQSLVRQAYGQYESAKGWATYDTFFNGGFIGDMVKYQKIDEATASMNQVKAASSRMNKELRDVDIVFRSELDDIDGTTKVFDIAFDNIFTDWNVRSRLEQNLSQLDSYQGKLNNIMNSLQRQLASVEEQINES